MTPLSTAKYAESRVVQYRKYKCIVYFTSRTVGVNTNSGSPTFSINFIASASNIDSLVWSFPGGTTQDSIPTNVLEEVTTMLLALRCGA